MGGRFDADLYDIAQYQVHKINHGNGPGLNGPAQTRARAPMGLGPFPWLHKMMRLKFLLFFISDLPLAQI